MCQKGLDWACKGCWGIGWGAGAIGGSEIRHPLHRLHVAPLDRVKVFGGSGGFHVDARKIFVLASNMKQSAISRDCLHCSPLLRRLRR